MQWSGEQGAGLGDLGLVWLMNDGVKTPLMFISSVHPEQEPREGRGGRTRLLNYNQHFVVLMRLACCRSADVHLNTDGEDGGEARQLQADMMAA